MKFSIDSPVRLLEVKNITSKAGNNLSFARFANMQTFETLELKVALSEGQAVTDLVEGHDYKAVVSYDGQYGSVTLSPTTATSKAGFPAK
jgi:translation elongation factor P/translation initiation factor 5A